jgi:capsular exopolysaccharide synthesis family protein
MNSNSNFNNGQGPGFGSYRQEKNENSQLGLTVKQIGSVLRRYKFSIFVITLAVAVIFGLAAFMSQPVYESDGSLLITETRDDRPPGGDGISALITSMYGIGMGNTIDNELEILRSRSLSLELADQIKEERTLPDGRQYPLLWKKFPEDSTMVSRDTLALRIRDNIDISQDNRQSNLIRITFQSASPLEAERIVNLTMNTYSELSTRHNRLSAGSAVQFLREERSRVKENLSEAEQAFRDFMNRTNLVSVDDQTRELITRISDLETTRRSMEVEKTAINTALAQYEKRLTDIQPRISGQYTGAVGPKMMRFQYQLAELETEKMLLLSRNPGIEDQPHPPVELREINAKIEQLQNNIQSLSDQLLTEDGQFLGLMGGRDGDMIRNIADLHERVIELQTQRNQFEMQSEQLAARLAEETSILENLPDNQIEYVRLRRDVEINEQLYRSLSQQLAEVSLWEHTRSGLGRPVDFGYVPDEPVSPKLKLFILAGLFMGGFFGLLYAGLRELTNRRIDGVTKLQSFNYPVLAVSPAIKTRIKQKYVRIGVHGRNKKTENGQNVSTQLALLVDRNSSVAESYRRLYNNVIYSNRGKKMQTVLVTSFKTGEGKTTASGNLGVAMAESRKKVLMIDTDIRNPKLHQLFGLKQTPGIYEIVCERADVHQVIQQTVMPGLELLPAGRQFFNPASLFQSDIFREMIEYFKTEYDHLLIKTAPFGILTDAAPLTEYTDGIILACRFNNTTEEEFHSLVENLERIHAPISGTLLTAFDPDKSLDYMYASESYSDKHKEYFTKK